MNKSAAFLIGVQSHMAKMAEIDALLAGVKLAELDDEQILDLIKQAKASGLLSMPVGPAFREIGRRVASGAKKLKGEMVATSPKTSPKLKSMSRGQAMRVGGARSYAGGAA